MYTYAGQASLSTHCLDFYFLDLHTAVVIPCFFANATHYTSRAHLFSTKEKTLTSL